MPRGVKKYTLEEKIERNQNEIDAVQTRLSELKEERNELLAEQKSVEIDRLYFVIQQSGRTVDDIIQMIESQAD